ncbi:hypothetical protein ACH42_17275 [Endozoicomonas sp. (ex Bugula neritina AB1)]|nr:hypothetical protein ACH42_17275 [Endozoicomonas sp. (ex Bugula neritina AB1)]
MKTLSDAERKKIQQEITQLVKDNPGFTGIELSKLYGMTPDQFIPLLVLCRYKNLVSQNGKAFCKETGEQVALWWPVE